MNNAPLPRNPELKKRAAELRSNATKEERHLWYDYLHSCTVRFNRQHIIGNYIVDFFSSKARLVIELDGSQHFEDKALEYDTARTKYLESLGLLVLRFANNDVMQNFEGVCQVIDIQVRQRLREQ